MLEIFPKYFQQEICKAVLDDFNYGRMEGALYISAISMSDDDYQLHIDSLQTLEEIKKECLLLERKFKLENISNNLRKVPKNGTFLNKLLLPLIKGISYINPYNNSRL